MPSGVDPADTVTTDNTDLPTAVHSAASRYWRRTLALRGVLGVGYSVITVVLVFTLPYILSLPTLVVLIGTLVAPVHKTGGVIELTTDRDADAVRDDFTTGIPPILGFQAALADDIRPAETGAEYDLSSVLGLRSKTMRVEAARVADTGDSDAPIELTVTVGGDPWGRYQVTIAERDDETAVTITINPDRRFGVRRLPDFIFGRRYRRHLFEPQGYTLVTDDTSVSL